MTNSDPARPRLVVTGGPLDGRELSFEKGVERRFGTGADCDLVVQAGHIEPLHATIVLEGDQLVLSDSGSVAGTYVNGEKVGTGRQLFDGDRVCLGPPGFRGSVKMVVSFAAVASPAAPVLLDPASFAPPTMPAAVPAAEDDGFRLDEASASPFSVTADEEEDWTLAAPGAAPPVALAMDAEGADLVPLEAEVEPEPVVAAPPAAAPPPPAPPAPPPAAPAPPAPRAPRAATAADYSDGFSIAPDRPREASPLNLPPPTRATHRASAPRPGTDWKRVLITNGVIAAVAVAGLLAWRAFNRPTDGAVGVEGPGGGSGEQPTLVRGPSITTLDPDVAQPGQSIRVRGTNLAGERVSVTIGGVPATVSTGTATEMAVVVPPVPGRSEGSTVDVVVQVGAEAGAPARLMLGRLPLLREATPPGGPGGRRVTLRGRGFAPSASGNRVVFGDVPALVLSARPDELVVVAPPLLAAPNDLRVTVQTGDGTSAGTAFRYEVPAAATFLPHFAATPALDHPDHDHAFVATALGPVLLLTGSPGQEAAPRAALAADALNALVASVTQGQVVPLSVRPGDEPAVLAAGRPEPLVTVTAADAAAFGEAWPGLKPSPTTPAALAAYWAALLQDHLTLFAVHARPLKLLELTPRGQVFLDVWAQAVRQGHGPSGVPMRLLNPVPETLARSLRELALTAPGTAKGTGSALLGLAGNWAGTTTEDGQMKRVRLRLQVVGKGLGGTLSTASGAVTMDLPLKDVKYSNGELSFRVLAGGSPRTFKGLFDGRQVNGTIAGKTGPIGDFRLELVE